MAGDGIGIEVMESGIAVLTAATPEVEFDFVHLEAGAGLYQRVGEALPLATVKEAERCDAILFGAMGLPGVRYSDGREIAPQLDLRTHFQLYAGLRPVRTIPGLVGPLKNPKSGQIDFVVVRESTEGLFAERENGVLINDEIARDSLVITRGNTERICNFAFELAHARAEKGAPGQVTCVDKANVLQSMAFFRKIFDECAANFPDITANHLYVDAAALDMVRRPWDLDVIVTENMFGDIISDLAAGVVGGMGVAPSADIGPQTAMFQPSHGSAPDITGQGIANPIAMILSVGMMLDWLGEKYKDRRCIQAASRIQSAVDRVFVDGEIVPADWGGNATTVQITQALIEKIDAREILADRKAAEI